MIKRIIATAAISGTLVLGGAGIASAATPAPSTTTHSYNCANAPKALARITKLETKAQTLQSKVAAREQKAQAAGRTKLAARLGRIVARIQKAETRGNTLMQKIEAACPSASTTPAS